MNWLGRFLYFVTAAVIFRLPGWGTKRVRVVVHNQQGQVLLIKSWLSHQRWTLPGGGIERGETPEMACVRETSEETGLVIGQNDLRYLTTIYDERLRADLLMYAVSVNDEKLSKLRFPYQFEIINRHWFDIDDLPMDASSQTRSTIKLAFRGEK